MTRRTPLALGWKAAALTLFCSFVALAVPLGAKTDSGPSTVVLEPSGTQCVLKPIPQVGGLDKFTVRSGDVVANGERCEYMYGNDRGMPGEEAYYSFSFSPRSDWNPSPNTSWNMIAQFHASSLRDFCNVGGQPTVSLKVHATTLRVAVYGGGCNEKQGDFTVGTFERGKTYNVVFHVRWAANESGLVEVWVNGAKKLSTVQPTLYRVNASKGVYLKNGHYRARYSQSSTIYQLRPRESANLADALAVFGDPAPAPEPEPTPKPEPSPAPTPPPDPSAPAPVDDFHVSSSPADGSTLSGAVRWEATVSGGTAERVEFLIDGKLRWTERYAPYVFGGDKSRWDTNVLANGKHSLRVRAVESDGRVATWNASIWVVNGSPAGLDRAPVLTSRGRVRVRAQAVPGSAVLLVARGPGGRVLGVARTKARRDGTVRDRVKLQRWTGRRPVRLNMTARSENGIERLTSRVELGAIAFAARPKISSAKTLRVRASGLRGARVSIVVRGGHGRVLGFERATAGRRGAISDRVWLNWRGQRRLRVTLKAYFLDRTLVRMERTTRTLKVRSRELRTLRSS